ncbi:hypothetical protein BDZ89DRAFT_467644 [Hymenopellis radicata]|nr:hypothetical protein BDZ89DRAFT_467644 [Hymenopellis radicata]
MRCMQASVLFHQVYAEDMPSRLPPTLLARRLAQQAFYGVMLSLRAVIVGMVWLAVLPWATVWTWRICFTIGELTAWYISDRTPPHDSGDIINPFYYNVQNDSSRPPTKTLLGDISNHPVWIALSSDIFTGQIIASMIVVIFVAIFLLREWISQNARPGIFDGEEIPPAAEERPAEAAPPADPDHHQAPDPEDHPVFPAMNLQDRLALAERQMEAVRALDHMQALRRGQKQRRLKKPAQGRPRRNSSAGETSGSRTLGDEAMTKQDERDEFRKQQRAFSRRLYVARMSNAMRREEERGSGSGSGSASPPSPPPLSAPIPSSAGWANDFTFTPPEKAKTPVSSASSPGPSESPFPSVVMQPPSASLPFSFNQSTNPPASTSSAPTTPFRRPPLPNTVLPSPGPSSPVRVSPMVSPGLATYRAPEDLNPEAEAEAGPSSARAKGYFDSTSLALDDDQPEQDEVVPEPEEDMDHYFRPEAEVDEEDAETLRNESEDDRPLSPGTDEQEEDEDEEGVDVDVDDEALDVEEQVMVVNEERPPPPPQENVGGGGPPDEAQDAAMAAGLNEDLDGADDDMEGALEAIGMRGPFHTIIQNATLMMFVLDTAIIVGVLLPFTIGKSTLLLSLDPQRFLQILHLPIRAIRVLTDPIVDTVVYVITKVIMPQYFSVVQGFLEFVLMGVLFGSKKVFGDAPVDKAHEAGISIYYRVLNATEAISSWTSSEASNATKVETPSEPSFLNVTAGDLWLRSSPISRHWERGPAFIWEVPRVVDGVALGHGPSDRVTAVGIGYAVVAFILLSYVHLLAVGNKETGKAVKNLLRQHVLVLKVAAFILIELVVFPLGCGVVLDLFALWLFSPSNLASRTVFLYQAPMTTTFYHWVAGTMFMYSFAVLLSGCRSIMRPGAMWFVKDPQDQNSHPIRDILDRSTITQLRKICVSAVMYTFIVGFTTASAATLLSIGSKSILPFRWKNREPLSKVPVDLLFLHFALPYTIHYFRPRKTVKKIVTAVWKYLAHQLRLTSYFFGGRYPIEEVTPPKWDVKTLWTSKFFLDPGAKQDGSFRRVPAIDSIALPRDVGATAAVDERGAPADAHAARLISIQNREAAKAKHDIKQDYTLVYLPPNFRYRMVTFIMLLWGLGAMSLGLVVALPIALGRGFFRLFVAEDVHDGYSFLLGFYLLWGCYIIGRAVERLDKRRQRRGEEGPRASLATLVFKRGLLWVAKTAYMVLFLGIVIPTLIAIVVTLYVILPIRLGLNPALVPKIRIVDEWALGLLYVKIALQARRVNPRGPIAEGIEHITHNGWTHPDPIAATKEVIAPMTGGLLAMILLPGLIFAGLQYLFPFINVSDKFLCKYLLSCRSGASSSYYAVSVIHVYPAIFIIAASSRSAFVSMDVLSSWSQSVRDKEFLVEMRLRNHESDGPKDGAEGKEIEVKVEVEEEEQEGEGRGRGGRYLMCGFFFHFFFILVVVSMYNTSSHSN